MVSPDYVFWLFICSHLYAGYTHLSLARGDLLIFIQTAPYPCYPTILLGLCVVALYS